MVVSRTTDVVVVIGQIQFLLGGQRLLVQAVLEDRFDALVAVAAQAQCAVTGRFQARLTIGLAQAHDPQTGPVALLGMRPIGEDGGNELRGGRSGLFRPVDEPGGRPLAVLAMGLGHVGRDRGVAAPYPGADVAGDALALVEDLDGFAGEPGIELAFDQLIGHRVVVAVELDVVVDMDPDLLPFGVGVGRGRQGLQRRGVEGVEQCSGDTPPVCETAGY